MGFDIYQGDALRDNSVFLHFFSKELDMLDSIASSHHKIPALTEFGYNEVPDSSLVDKSLLPTIKPTKLFMHWPGATAGKKQARKCRVLCTLSGAASAPDFKKMSAIGENFI